MERFQNGYFYNQTCGNLTFNGTIKEIIKYLKEKKEKSYEIIVGCDSPSQEEPTFPAVIVVLKKGEGGRFFLKKIHYKERKFYNYHQRILEEVLLSIELALCLRDSLEKEISLDKEKESLKYQFRYIHADVGERGQTKDMVREIIGLIRGNGFEPKIKPESFAASVVADRYT